MEVSWLAPPVSLALGDRSYDLTNRALVMGILNRTKDSFFAPAATYNFDDFLKRAEQLVKDGADLLDVGGVKAGPGDEVSESEELDRVVPAIAAASILRSASIHGARVSLMPVLARARWLAMTSVDLATPSI